MANFGPQNRGAFYDKVAVGVHGPVKVLADINDYDYDDDEVIQDLSKSKWYYKVGLHGEHEMHYSYPNSLKTWFTDNIPTNRIFVWYKVKLLIVAIQINLHKKKKL